MRFSFFYAVFIFIFCFKYLSSGENKFFVSRDGKCSFFSNDGVILFKFDGCNASDFKFSKDFKWVNILDVKEKIIILGVRIVQENDLTAKVAVFDFDGNFLYENSTSTDSIIAISSRGNYLLSYGGIFSKNNNKYEKYLDIPKYVGGSNYVFSENEKFFAFRYRNSDNKTDTIEIFDLKNKKIVKKIECSSNLFGSLAFSKDSRYIYFIDGDFYVKIISMSDFSLVNTIKTNPNEAHNLKGYRNYITVKFPYINSVVGYSLRDYSLVWKRSVDDQIVDYNLNWSEDTLFILTYDPDNKNKFIVKRIKI